MSDENLKYVGGDVLNIHDVDVDFICFNDISKIATGYIDEDEGVHGVTTNHDITGDSIGECLGDISCISV
jgi:hypothetical protein